MPRMLVALVGACALALAALAGSASAGPAQTWSAEACYGFYDYQVCGAWRGVDSVTSAPSGNMVWTGHYTSEYTITYVPTGEVVQISRQKYNYGGLVKGSELQVLHNESVGTTSYGGITCKGVFRSVWANGQIRHEIGDFTCS